MPYLELCDAIVWGICFIALFMLGKTLMDLGAQYRANRKKRRDKELDARWRAYGAHISPTRDTFVIWPKHWRN